MIKSNYRWQKSQGYIAFMVSGILISNNEDRVFVADLLKKHDKGITWSRGEVNKILKILDRRNRQISSWELDLANKKAKSGSNRSSEAFDK